MILIAATVVLVALSVLSIKPKPFSQGKLNDLVYDLGLSKKSSKILASCFGKHSMLDSGTKITFYHDRDDLLTCLFTVEDDFVYCNNIQGLSEMGLPSYNLDEWRLFVDSSKRSLKCVYFIMAKVCLCSN